MASNYLSSTSESSTHLFGASSICCDRACTSTYRQDYLAATSRRHLAIYSTSMVLEMVLASGHTALLRCVGLEFSEI